MKRSQWETKAETIYYTRTGKHRRIKEEKQFCTKKEDIIATQKRAFLKRYERKLTL